MKARLFSIFLVGIIATPGFGAAISSNAVTGNWNAPTSWAGGVVPGSGDDVTIVAGASITLNVDRNGANSINSLTVAGTFNPNTFNLTVNGMTNITGTYTDVSNVGTNVFTGKVTVSGTGSWNSTSLTTVSNLVFRGGIDCISVNANPFQMSVATFDASQTISGNNTVSFNNTLVVNAFTLTISNSGTTGFTQTNNGVINATPVGGSAIILASGGRWTNSSTIATASTIDHFTAQAGSFYVHNRNGNSIVKGTTSTTWDATSTCSVTGGSLSGIGNFDQDFGNLTWVPTSQSTDVILLNNLTSPTFSIQGTLTVSHTDNKRLILCGGTTSGTFSINKIVLSAASAAQQATVALNGGSGNCVFNVNSGGTNSDNNVTIGLAALNRPNILEASVGTGNSIVNIKGQMVIHSFGQYRNVNVVTAGVGGSASLTLSGDLVIGASSNGTGANSLFSLVKSSGFAAPDGITSTAVVGTFSSPANLSIQNQGYTSIIENLAFSNTTATLTVYGNFTNTGSSNSGTNPASLALNNALTPGINNAATINILRSTGGVNGNFTWNTTNNGQINLNGSTTASTNTNTGIINVEGNFTFPTSGGTMTTTTSQGPVTRGVIRLTGNTATTQNFLTGGVGTLSNHVDFEFITGAGGVTLGSPVTLNNANTRLILNSGTFTTTNTLTLGGGIQLRRINGTITATPSGTSWGLYYGTPGSASNLTTGLELPAAANSLNALTFDRGAGNTVTLNKAVSLITGTGSSLTTGNLDVSTFLISSAGGAVVFTTGANTTLRIGGTGNNLPLNNNTSATYSFHSSSTVEYYGSTQTIGNPNVNLSLGNLQFTGAGDKTLARLITLSGTLTLNNGVLALGNNNLVLLTTAGITGSYSATSMISTNGTGIFSRQFTSTASALVSPVGTGTIALGTNRYSPATLTFTSGTIASSAVLNIRCLATTHPNATGAGTKMVKYWETSLSGVASPVYDLVCTYNDPAEFTGATGFLGYYKFDGTWTKPAGTFNSVAKTLSFAGVTQSPITTFTAATAATAFVDSPVTIYYSIADNTFNNTASWSTTGYGGASCSCTPPAASTVFIGNGRTITLTGASPALANLTIEAGGTLDANGFTPGTITSLNGSGTIRNQAASGTAVLITGTTNNFINTLGSTYEFSGTSTYNVPTSLLYRNLKISGNSTKTLAGATTINENLTITTGTLECAGATLIVNRNTLVDGTLSFSSNSNTKTFNGAVTVNGTWNQNNSPATVTLNDNLVFGNSATATVTSGSITLGGTGKTISGSPSNLNFRDVVVNGSYTNTMATGFGITTTLSGTGSFIQGTNGVLNFGGSAITVGTLNATTNSPNTVNYNGTGAQTIRAVNYDVLTISGGANLIANAKTLSLNTAVRSLDVQSGFFSTGNFLLTGSGAGTLNVATNSTLHLAGNPTAVPFPSGFTATALNVNSTVVYAPVANSATIDPLPTYGNLTIAGGGTGNRNPTGNLIVMGNLVLTSPSSLNMNAFDLNVRGNFTGSGALVFTTGNFNLGGSGNLHTGTFTQGSGILTFDGTSAQTLRGVTASAAAAYVYSSIVFNGGGTKSFDGFAKVTNSVKLVSGVIDMGAYEFILGTSCTIDPTSTLNSTSMFLATGNGSLRKETNGGAFVFTFPVGTSGLYSPATFNFTASTCALCPGTPGWISVNPKSGQYAPPLVGAPVRAITKYWVTASSGLTNLVVDPSNPIFFSYNNGEVPVPADETSYVGLFYVLGDFIYTNATLVDDVNNKVNFTNTYLGVMSDVNGQWTAATLSSTLGGGTVYYSRNATLGGNWNSGTTWSTTGHGGAACSCTPPTSNGKIIVPAGHTVILNDPAVTDISNLDVNGIFDFLSVKPTVGNLSGSGRIRLSASSGICTFPTINPLFFTFADNATSVVEFNGSGSYSLPSSPTSYKNLVVSGGGTKTLTGNIAVDGDFTLSTSGTTLDLTDKTLDRSSTGGGTFTAASGTTVRSGNSSAVATVNSFPDKYSTYVLTGSTVEFYPGSNTNQNIPNLPFFNITFSGDRGGRALRFPTSGIRVAGSLDASTLANSSLNWGSQGSVIDFNGTGSQFIPANFIPGGFQYNGIRVSGTRSPGSTVTFDNTGIISVVDKLEFTANQLAYNFSGSTLEFRGTGSGYNVSLTSSPVVASSGIAYPYNNVVISSDGADNLILAGNTVEIAGNLTINISRSLNLASGNLTMVAGSTVSVLGTLRDNNNAGTNTLNNTNLTVGPAGLIDLSQSTASLGTTTGTLTFNGGTVGGAGLFTGSLSVGSLAMTGNGTLSRGDFTVTGTSQISIGNTLNFSSLQGTKTFGGNVSVDGTWSNTLNLPISFGAGLHVNAGATFTPGNGVQTFTGTGTIAGTIPAAVTIPNISLSAGAVLTNARTAGLTISNSFGSGTGTLIQGANAVLNYEVATAIVPSLDATAIGNVVNYNAPSANLKPTHYQNLNLPAGGNYLMGADVSVQTSLNLNSVSKVRTFTHSLILSPGATISGSGSTAYVWGNLQKNVHSGSPVVTFEVGDAASYTPIHLSFTGVTAAGDLRVFSTPPISATPVGLLLNKAVSVNRFWNLTSVNTLTFSTFNGIFNFSSSDYIGGATNADLKAGIHDGSNWTYPSVSGLSGEMVTINNSAVLGTVVFAICTPPVTFTLTGTFSGGYCAGDPGSTLTLSGSQNGADYQLRLGGTDIGSPLAGTGLPLNFGDFTTNGAYTVIATTGLTGCSSPMSGTVNVVTNPLPTLTSVSQASTVCSGTTATVLLAGLLPSSNLTIAYSLNGVPQAPVSVTSDATGAADFNLPVSDALNGFLLTVTGITNTSLVPNCSQAFVTGNSFALAVYPRPTVSISANDFVCLDQTAPVEFYFTGTGPWTMTYKMGNPNSPPLVAQPVVISGSSPYATSYTLASVDRRYEITSLSDANCAAVSAGLDSFTIDVPIPCSITWNGSANDGNWNNPNNWIPNNSAPSDKTSVIIPGGVPQPNINSITPTPVCATLTLTGSASPTISSGFHLNVRGDLHGTISPSFSGQGKIVLTGTGTQTIHGTVRLTHVDFANTSGGGVVIAPGGTLQIEPNGVATFLPNSKITNNGTFLLASTATGTGKIGPIPTSAVINGPVTQQRYLPYSPGISGNWYMIGSPFSGRNFTDWVDNFKVTGLNTGFGAQGGGILNSPQPERSTIFKYMEANHNLRIDTVQKIGWTIPGNENIIPGVGYRTFISYYGNSNHVFDNSGTLTRGSGLNNEFTFPTLTRNEYTGCIPASFPCSEPSWRGWNLIANPFPCDVDWDAPGGWTKPASMSNAWYRWNAEGLGYGLYTNGVGYIGASPAPSNPNLIPSGQAFFVRLNTAGSYTASLIVKESAKSISASATFLRTASDDQKLKVVLSQSTEPNAYSYSALVRFKESATDGFDPEMDFTSLGGSRFSIGILEENSILSVASFAPVVETKSIPLSINYAGTTGNFILRFNELESLSGLTEVYLRDNLLGQIQLITPEFSYNYAVSPQDGLLGERFELVFSPVTLTNTKQVLHHRFDVYPNPGNGKEIGIKVHHTQDESGWIVLSDVLGREVMREPVSLQKGESTKVLKTSLPVGVYNLELKLGSTIRKRTLVVQ